eukprot:CAMPEP_0184737844 /NCGR_PEP_ID=MMETSP0315-20130426/612_1 /TAXON_ID=101924 /ORGANISM="Rhodosorus marinus, Strain UTEX LB 2760" /LENGTH=589 /DNA_ID=CAMNT_0027205269 /DNA_START=168 /DNA_END=1937 /DNA_ORIENTATION=-
MENGNHSEEEGDHGKEFDSDDVENSKGVFLNVGDVSGAVRVVTDDKCELDLDKRESVTSVDEEFGKVDVMHLKTRRPISLDASAREKVLFIVCRRRHLAQFFCRDVLYREKKKRKVADDELFMDLILVACFAEFGHELRDTFDGWPSVEKFFLLFQVVWMVWRTVAYILNLFPLEQDFAQKSTMLGFMIGLISVGLSAHTSFSSTIPWASWSAFAVTCFSGLVVTVLGSQSSKIGTRNPIYNAVMLTGLSSMVFSIPYVISAAVNNADVARAMFWTSFGIQVAYFAIVPLSMREFHRRRGRSGVSPAINIEAFSEKFGLITLITLGESFISLLFESALVASPERAGVIVAVGILGLGITYSLMTIYFDIDNKILPGEKHAVRYAARKGIAWSMVHLFYHACLILGATGLGEALQASAESIVNAEKSARVAVEASIRAGEAGGGAVFDAKWRWLLCAGYGAAVLFSTVLSMCHQKGPYSVTRYYRLGARTVIVIASLLTSVPLSTSLSPLSVVGIVFAVICTIAAVEFFLVQGDRLHLWGWIDYPELREKHPPGLDEISSVSSGETGGDSLIASLHYSGHVIGGELPRTQ